MKLLENLIMKKNEMILGQVVNFASDFYFY